MQVTELKTMYGQQYADAPAVIEAFYMGYGFKRDNDDSYSIMNMRDFKEGDLVKIRYRRESGEYLHGNTDNYDVDFVLSVTFPVHFEEETVHG